MPRQMRRYLPILDWGRGYGRQTLAADLIAAVIVTIMLIPQSLAYALLAGLPPEAGLYASIAPILLYAVFGTSRELAVGPVAVVSLMTPAAIGGAAQAGVGHVAAALMLALLSGAMLLAMGLLRMGFIANFLSHPVIAGFITASGILIAISQLRHILGVPAEGHTLPGMLQSLAAHAGAVAQNLPPLTMPALDPDLIRALALPALLISVIGFVESISVAQTLAARKRQRIEPDQELIGLGAANLGAAFTGGFPVTGGFSRSDVNFDAGAATPAAGAFTAIGLAIAALALTPLIHYLPKATLAATIIVAVLSLVDFGILRHAWRYSRADFAAVLATVLLTLAMGVEAGVSAGVVLSIALHLWRSARPHVAEVGLVPGSQHFRNILRHEVLTDPAVLTLRIDESLWFANARFLEDYILNRLADDTAIRHVVLMCSAINEIDFSALESLEELNTRLREQGITLHLSEVKGPVMDRLKRAHLLDDLTGRVFLSQWDAWVALSSAADGGATRAAQ